MRRAAVLVVRWDNGHEGRVQPFTVERLRAAGRRKVGE
jgi:hypothetical protein